MRMTARRPWALIPVLMVLAVVSPLALGVASPQDTGMVRILGSVQWISGTRMQLIAESGSSVAIDLTEADQASYQALRAGDVVAVDGVVAPDRRRIIAREVWRYRGGQDWNQAP
jgi:hypothetical protein